MQKSRLLILNAIAFSTYANLLYHFIDQLSICDDGFNFIQALRFAYSLHRKQ